jgi:hypothetical protein
MHAFTPKHLEAMRWSRVTGTSAVNRRIPSACSSRSPASRWRGSLRRDTSPRLSIQRPSGESCCASLKPYARDGCSALGEEEISPQLRPREQESGGGEPNVCMWCFLYMLHCGPAQGDVIGPTRYQAGRGLA